MNIEEVAKLYYPPICLPLNTLMICNKMLGRRVDNKKAYELMQNRWEKYIRRAASNNWLRLHGYPMRRRRH